MILGNMSSATEFNFYVGHHPAVVVFTSRIDGLWDRMRWPERPGSKARFWLPGLDAFTEIPTAKVKDI